MKLQLVFSSLNSSERLPQTILTENCILEQSWRMWEHGITPKISCHKYNLHFGWASLAFVFSKCRIGSFSVVWTFFPIGYHTKLWIPISLNGHMEPEHLIFSSFESEPKPLGYMEKTFTSPSKVSLWFLTSKEYVPFISNKNWLLTLLNHNLHLWEDKILNYISLQSRAWSWTIALKKKQLYICKYFVCYISKCLCKSMWNQMLKIFS